MVPTKSTEEMNVAGCMAMRGNWGASDVYDAMLSAAPQTTEQEGWQPIETAPRDQVLLLAAEYYGAGDWRIKCGCSLPGGGWLVWGASWEPTHWMPLPPPPTDSDSGMAK